MKTPNTKIQTPEKLQVPNPKLRQAGLMHYLYLGFVIYLELGVWDLVFRLTSDH
jgi:hypothetical protein